MAIDPRYVASMDLQEYLVDKDTGLPLSGGLVYFYQDNSRTTLQSVYTISGNAPNYNFVPLPNPIVLSGVGTIQDNNGNDVIPYYLPFLIVDGEITTTQSLYFVVVQNQLNEPQFTREAWPPNAQEGGGGGGGDGNGLFNFIPNGQFLTHNTIHPNNTLSPGKTAIAPGGWQFVLPDPSSSVNTLQFINLNSYTPDIPQSPPFTAQIACTMPDSGDSIKSLRVQFNDVNKFASDLDQYTFAFAGQSLSSTINVDVNIVKYFGTGDEVITTKQTITLTNDIQFFSLTPWTFGDNAGVSFGNAQTYVAIDIAFPTSVAFNVTLTDFALVAGNVVLTDYPVQTNADTITRSIYGWTDLPNPNGFQLYLPPVLTSYGMTWDNSVIGKIEASIFPVINPNSTSPFPISNDMLCDGESYIYGNYSSIDIPFARLGQKLISNSSIPNTPMFGTGADYATGYSIAGESNTLRLTVNSPGTGSADAEDFDTGWAIGSIVNYGGSSSGSDSLGYKAYSNVADTLLAVNSSQDGTADVGTSPFTLTIVGGPINYTDLLCQQNFAFTLLCTAGSTLITGTTGLYFDFSNGVDGFRMWFQTGTETAPAADGNELIELTITGSYTAQDVANVVREAISAYQISTIVVSNLPSPGQYWIFFANPTSPRRFNVWYSLNGAGSPPNVPGTNIEVALTGAPTNAEIVTATLIAINQYQYAAPPFEGMFPRGYDPTMLWDLDAAQRWSSISGLSGAFLGTFEFQQLLAHKHTIGQAVVTAGVNDVSQEGGTEESTNLTGGSETRPVNFYVNWIIKY